MDKLEDLLKRLQNANHVAVLTGAGVSAESGISTFRDPDGLWSKFNPAELASMDGFMTNSELVWEWYQYRRNIIANVEPNAGHFALAEMEKYFDKFTLITQNVDRLHQRAGSSNPIELHGNIIENHCIKCQKPFTEQIDYTDKTVLKCGYCGGNIRPSVVWFGEMLPPDALDEASEVAETCDVFFSIGTSAEVYPAASLPIYAMRSGAYVVEINPNHTAISNSIHLKIAEPSAYALPKILALLKENK